MVKAILLAGLVCVGAAVADQTYTPETTMGAKNEEPVDWDHSNVLTVLSSIVYPPGLDLLMHYRYFDLRCMTGDVHMTTIMVQRDKPIRSKTHVHRTLTSGVEDISEESAEYSATFLTTIVVQPDPTTSSVQDQPERSHWDECRPAELLPAADYKLKISLPVCHKGENVQAESLPTCPANYSSTNPTSSTIVRVLYTGVLNSNGRNGGATSPWEHEELSCISGPVLTSPGRNVGETSTEQQQSNGLCPRAIVTKVVGNCTKAFDFVIDVLGRSMEMVPRLWH